jgi:hypothetical protein
MTWFFELGGWSIMAIIVFIYTLVQMKPRTVSAILGWLILCVPFWFIVFFIVRAATEFNAARITK